MTINAATVQARAHQSPCRKPSAWWGEPDAGHKAGRQPTGSTALLAGCDTSRTRRSVQRPRTYGTMLRMKDQSDVAETPSADAAPYCPDEAARAFRARSWRLPQPWNKDASSTSSARGRTELRLKPWISTTSRTRCWGRLGAGYSAAWSGGRKSTANPRRSQRQRGPQGREGSGRGPLSTTGKAGAHSSLASCPSMRLRERPWLSAPPTGNVSSGPSTSFARAAVHRCAPKPAHVAGCAAVAERVQRWTAARVPLVPWLSFDRRQPSPVAFPRSSRPHSVRCLSDAAGW